jgi:nicotinamidase-related amidase
MPDEAVHLDWTASALLIVDVMNDFVDEQGAFLRLGYATLTPEERSVLIRNNQALIERMREIGRPVVYIRGEYRSDHLDWFGAWIKQKARPPGIDIPEGTSVALKEPGSWGAQIIDEIAPQPDDVIVVKKGHSGFGFTEAALVLRNLGIKTCIATGGASSGCLSDTVREGVAVGIDFVIVRDATYPAADPVLAILADHCGLLATTEHVLRMLDEPDRASEMTS